MNVEKKNVIVALMREAHLDERAGRVAQARRRYRQIVDRYPDFDPAWHALGVLAHAGGDAALALRCVETAIAANGAVALYHRNACEMYRRLRLYDKALAAGLRACALAPQDIDAQYNLGLVYTDTQEYASAAACYELALKLNPRHAMSWNNLGSAHEKLQDKDAAMAAYLQAVAADPRHAEAQNNLGAVYAGQGKLDEARACFEAAVAARPDFVEAHFNLSSLKHYGIDDPQVTLLKDMEGRSAHLDAPARTRYYFALGKALDDTGDYDRAFAAYEAGNRLHHDSLASNEAAADALTADIVRIFDPAFFAARRHWQGARDAARTPVFIVGMPRSGTTLLEQILASHGAVFGAGELPDLSEVVTAATEVPGRPFTDGVAVLDERAVREIGLAYLRRVWRHAPASRFITDKMPANFFYLGILHLALPHARIIHAMRDPMDSCFSCYARLFQETMAFAYDQGTLGRYYGRYMTLMRHWHAVLPPGAILDVRYEDMVADTEAQARRVIDFLGLPWDGRCLEFHKNARQVKTASVAQVRRPIYRGSVARWKHFARHLAPLYALVKPWRDGTGWADGAEDALFAGAAPQLPAAPDAVHLEGIMHYRQGRLDAAQACYRQALALRPDFPEALNSAGFLLQDIGRLDEAHACFARAVELAPHMGMARLNLGMLQLKLGQWQAGWDNYEARWSGSAEAGNGSLRRLDCPLPLWDGSGRTEGRRLLVITEQGFGDTFQFARYLPLAARRFDKVGFVCSLPTQRLIEWAWGDSVVTFTRMPSDFAAWDCQCPLMSLPRAFGTLPATIPADVPYLAAPPTVARHWRERLDLAAPAGLRVGIAWAGRKAHQHDARRSLAFARLRPLFAVGGVTWVSLQKWAPEDSRPAIPADLRWLDWTEELTDFADTAALLTNLDLVVSIDSSMVHLAGALGRPVWMMNRYDGEWRWFDRRADSPWYPTLRIFNQSAPGDWDGVLAAVAAALAALPRPAAAAVAGRAAPALPSPALAPPDPAQAFALAAQLQGAGRPDQAEQVLRQLLAAIPDHAHALHLLGVIAWGRGDGAAATELIGQAIALDAGTALFHSNLAEMRRQQGRVDDAIAHGERAILLDPSLATAHSNLAIAYYDRGDLDRAEACQHRALAIAPDLPHACNNLGSIARARKLPAEAAGWYRRSLELQPDYLEALSNLGAVLLEADRIEEAELPLARALERDPRCAEALCNLGLVRLRQRRPDEALALLERSLALRPHDAHARRGLERARLEQRPVAPSGGVSQ